MNGAGQIIDDVLAPNRFYVRPPHRLRVERAEAEDVPWEIFHGHLLDASSTRERRSFRAWNAFLDPGSDSNDHRPDSPLLSVKWDEPQSKIFVVRNLLTHGWETYEEPPGVIQSRRARKWTPELVATVQVDPQNRERALRDELAATVLLAVIGTSRLPITSLETPIPAFIFGQLMYTGTAAADARPWSDAESLVRLAATADSSTFHRAKLLETALRTVDRDGVALLVSRVNDSLQNGPLTRRGLVALLKTLFNTVATSPYTNFVPNLVSFLKMLAVDDSLGRPAVIDLLSYMLRQLVRHLTAFDLHTFHNFGANYPDALMLDALLKAYLAMTEESPGQFLGDRPRSRRRRRALRQAWMIRKQYEGHRVPDAPTSAGEVLRVLPDPFVRVPEEQITQPTARRKQLFAGDPLDALAGDTVRALLDQCTVDLQHDEELQELGTALFLDRPLGVFKAPGESDRTPMLSYEAFSREIAGRRLRAWSQSHKNSPSQLPELFERLEAFPVLGMPVEKLPKSERPGVVSLDDANKVAADFVFLRTTRSSWSSLMSQYDFELIRGVDEQTGDWLFSQEWCLAVRTNDRAFTVFDERLQPRCEFEIPQPDVANGGYVEAAGVEYLAGGLRLAAVWKADGSPVAHASPLVLPRFQASEDAHPTVSARRKS